MSSRISTRVRAENAPAPSFTRAPGRMLQRKCACGGTVVTGGECAECRKKRLQTKLAVNQPGDRFEQEADRMAEFDRPRWHSGRNAIFQLLVRRTAARRTQGAAEA